MTESKRIRVVFQGDSITDVGRSRNYDRLMGGGYAAYTAARLSYRFPGEYEFFNRGVGGDRSADLYARWRTDTLNLAPDIVTILVGVNDVWHELDAVPAGIEAARTELNLELLVQYTREQNLNVKIIILEPFVRKGSATEEHWDLFSREVPLRAEAAKRVAEKYGCVFIPLQQEFDALCEKGPEDCWLADGVHPYPAGHQMISDKLTEALLKLRTE
ncbi:MAG: SGNH/GDSL hydrolase family protein [Clostridia bacterium]|nr:SGNH/GDSL hydrolase family protein [Clostridia bacterium]